MEMSSGIDVTPTGARPRWDRDLGALVGSRCDSCDTVVWPGRAFCHRCGEPAMRATAFATTGSLLTHTTVWVPRPGLRTPYTLGQVKLDDGPLIFGHVQGVTAATLVPAAVRLVLDPDPEKVPPFHFQVEAPQ